MERITATLDEAAVEALDLMVEQRGYAGRSEALREIIRSHGRPKDPLSEEPCIGILSFVYDHATRLLAKRLTDAQHHRHDLTVASLHVHLDHETCLEVCVLKGSQAAVRSLSNELTAQRGVRHADLHLVPARIASARHDHGSGSAPHEHIHA